MAERKNSCLALRLPKLPPHHAAQLDDSVAVLYTSGLDTLVRVDIILEK